MLVLFDFVGGLNKSAAVTATSHEGVIARGTINVVLLPGLAAQHHNRDTGCNEAAEKKIEKSALTQLLSIGVD